MTTVAQGTTEGQKGFTLVELVIIIVVIGILATLGWVSYTGAKKTARLADAKQELASFSRVLSKYKAERGAYPSTTNNLSGEYTVQFTSRLYATTAYYNLLYCSQSPYGHYALTATTSDGRRIYVTDTDSATEYTGSVNWSINNITGICGSVLAGSSNAGPAGYRGNVTPQWRAWTNTGN